MLRIGYKTQVCECWGHINPCFVSDYKGRISAASRLWPKESRGNALVSSQGAGVSPDVFLIRDRVGFGLCREGRLMMHSRAKRKVGAVKPINPIFACWRWYG